MLDRIFLEIYCLCTTTTTVNQSTGIPHENLQVVWYVVLYCRVYDVTQYDMKP